MHVRRFCLACLLLVGFLFAVGGGGHRYVLRRARDCSVVVIFGHEEFNLQRVDDNCRGLVLTTKTLIEVDEYNEAVRFLIS